MHDHPESRSSNWRILTSGPCPLVKSKSIAEVATTLRTNVVLKRGWSVHIAFNLNGNQVARTVKNSKGKVQPSYGAMAYRLDKKGNIIP